MNLYFLLEYLQGGELLQQLLHENHQVGLHEDLARFYLADIANAVDYLHDHAIMHRDLKPENMVVSTDDGHLRLIDFGTAKDLENPSLNGPNFVGTPEYMAPETVDNKDTTFAGDVWAFGCITFQLLAGETPFSGGSVYLTLLKVQSGTFTMPTFLSEAAQDLIRKCLQLKPEARPTIKEIKGAVRCAFIHRY
jgi:3-phosphoinositide dependent protein kinase-1